VSEGKQRVDQVTRDCQMVTIPSATGELRLASPVVQFKRVGGAVTVGHHRLAPVDLFVAAPADLRGLDVQSTADTTTT
jgi:hypothetical protein